MYRKVASVFFLLYLAVIATSCGGGQKSSNPSVQVSVSPTTMTVHAGMMQQFTATVSNAQDSRVRWQVNGVTGGQVLVGTINPSGLFTAPAAVPSPATVTVAAVSNENLSLGAASQVTIVPPVSATISPQSPSVIAGKTQQFTATVSNAIADQTVIWSVSGTGCTGAACGTIDATGRYTAPSSVPTPPVVTVKAVSNEDATKSASTQVTILVPPPVIVTISPLSPTVLTDATEQFVASVTNADDRTVTWSVAGAGCAGAACGMIDATGLYTAPSSVPTPPTVTVTAASNADVTKSASTQVTILSAVKPAVTVTPSTTSIKAKSSTDFTVNVTGTSQTDVDWSISGAGCTGTDCGTIDSNGHYIAPNTVPNPALVTVKAALKSDASTFGTADVTILPDNCNDRLNGNYAFWFSGYNGTSEVIAGGSFHADGTGNIDSFVTDMRDGAGAHTKLPRVAGTYTVGCDNHGTMSLTTSVNGTNAAVTYAFVLKSDGNGRMIEFDDATGTGSHGTGEFKKQDATALILPNGNYAFMVVGSANGAGRTAIAGRFTTDGTGVITSGASDVRVAGQNAPGAGVNTLTSSSLISDPDTTVATVGRSKITLTPGAGGTYNFAMYMVSSTEGFLINVDSAGPAMVGSIRQQVASGGTFSLASLTGNVIFAGSGYDLTPGGRTRTMVFFANLNGSGTINSGSYYDQNDVGDTVATWPAVLTGTYSMAASGRGQWTLKDSTGKQLTAMTMYMYDTNKGFVIDKIPAGAVSDVMAGEFNPQNPVTIANLSGTFAFGWTDNPYTGVRLPVGAVGFSATGFSGTGEDSASTGLLTGQAISTTYSSCDPVLPRCQGSLVLPDGTHAYAMWFVSPTKAYIIGNDHADGNLTIMVVEQ